MAQTNGVYGLLCAYIRSNVFGDVDGTLSDFMRTILVYLFCGEEWLLGWAVFYMGKRL